MTTKRARPGRAGFSLIESLVVATMIAFLFFLGTTFLRHIMRQQNFQKGVQSFVTQMNDYLNNPLTGRVDEIFEAECLIRPGAGPTPGPASPDRVVFVENNKLEPGDSDCAFIGLMFEIGHDNGTVSSRLDQPTTAYTVHNLVSGPEHKLNSLEFKDISHWKNGYLTTLNQAAGSYSSGGVTRQLLAINKQQKLHVPGDLEISHAYFRKETTTGGVTSYDPEYILGFAVAIDQASHPGSNLKQFDLTGTITPSIKRLVWEDYKTYSGIAGARTRVDLAAAVKRPQLTQPAVIFETSEEPIYLCLTDDTNQAVVKIGRSQTTTTSRQSQQQLFVNADFETKCHLP